VLPDCSYIPSSKDQTNLAQLSIQLTPEQVLVQHFLTGKKPKKEAGTERIVESA